MKFDRRIAATVATLVIAIAAGHLVQNAEFYFGETEQPRMANTAAAGVPEVVRHVTPLAATATATPRPHAAPQLPDEAARLPVLAVPDTTLPRRLAALDRELGTRSHLVDNQFNQYGMSCESTLRATVLPAAMIELALNAPCHGDAIVRFDHGQLRFTAALGPGGTLRLNVPALAVEAAFVAQIEGGQILTATAKVPEAAEFERIAVQWSGADRMQIHAYEFGAGFDDDGHVWAGAPRDAALGATGRGGFLTRLGAPDLPAPRMAEVYSYPRGAGRDSGVVRINIEAEVTAANCGRQISAETIQPGFDALYEIAKVTLSVPGCDAVGEFLVLKNILRDLKIASN